MSIPLDENDACFALLHPDTQHNTNPQEEFRYAVFQLADSWTLSVDVAEYAAFLDKGFRIVFQDLIEKDTLQLPAVWKKKTNNVKSLTALPESRVLDCIAQIFSDKIKADKVDRQKGHELDTLAQ